MGIEKATFWLLLTVTGLLLFIGWLAFRKRELPIAKYLCLLMLTCAIYSFGFAFEVVSRTEEALLLWIKFQYLGLPFIALCWFLMVVHYTGYQWLLKRTVLGLLLVPPSLVLLFNYTNELHNQYYRDVVITIGSEHAAIAYQLIKGPLYWIHIAYSYSLMLAGMGMFILCFARAAGNVRRQVAVLMAGAAAPWFLSITYVVFGFGSMPFGFTITGLCYIWGIYRFEFLKWVPVALQNVFETMQDGVVILDYAGNVTNMNQAALDIFVTDNQKAAIVSGPAASVFSSCPDLLERLKSKQNAESRLVLTTAKQGLRTYQLKLSVIFDRRGSLLGRTLIFHDITEAEEDRRQLLEKSNQLAEVNAFKDKLFTVVAHDIRDPLAVLMSLTEVLEAELKESEHEDLPVFRQVSGQVRNTYLLVENLLDWFRSQREQISLRPLTWDLAYLVMHAIQAVQVRSVRKDIQIEADVDRDLFVYADKEMLELVLRNLLSNSVKFTPLGGIIRVGAERSEDMVTVTVRDSGPGVDPSKLAALFREVQHTAEQGSDGESGSGIGLYLCGKFVQMNGGDIWYEGNEQTGGAFCFTIPAADWKRSAG